MATLWEFFSLDKLINLLITKQWYQKKGKYPFIPFIIVNMIVLTRMALTGEAYIPLNQKKAPASDWLFFCLSSVELENSSPKLFCNWHAQIFEKCCMRFYLDWRRRRRIERWKLFLPDTVCIEYFLYLLSSLEVSFKLLFSIYIY